MFGEKSTSWFVDSHLFAVSSSYGKNGKGALQSPFYNVVSLHYQHYEVKTIKIFSPLKLPNLAQCLTLTSQWRNKPMNGEYIRRYLGNAVNRFLPNVLSEWVWWFRESDPYDCTLGMLMLSTEMLRSGLWGVEGRSSNPDSLYHMINTYFIPYNCGNKDIY